MLVLVLGVVSGERGQVIWNRVQVHLVEIGLGCSPSLAFFFQALSARPVRFECKTYVLADGCARLVSLVCVFCLVRVR